MVFGKGRIQETEQAISSLWSFIQQIYRGVDLTPEETRRNVEKGLVEIIDDGEHSSNGILITDDGYFVTAYHCLDDGVKGKYIVLDDGEQYKIKKVCARSKPHDILLAKANIKAPSEPMNYRFSDISQTYWRNSLVGLMTRRNGEIISKGGFFKGKSISYPAFGGRSMSFHKDHFEVEFSSAASGDSGGIFLTEDGSILGIHSSSSSIYRAKIAKWNHVLRLIGIYVGHLKKNSC